MFYQTVKRLLELQPITTPKCIQSTCPTWYSIDILLSSMALIITKAELITQPVRRLHASLRCRRISFLERPLQPAASQMPAFFSFFSSLFHVEFNLLATHYKTCSQTSSNRRVAGRNLAALAVTLPLAYGIFVRAITERICRSRRNREDLGKVFSSFIVSHQLHVSSRYRSAFTLSEETLGTVGTETNGRVECATYMCRMSGSFIENFMILNIIYFADMVRREESFITMKLIWHGYLVSSLDIYVYETPTKTSLTSFWS